MDFATKSWFITYFVGGLNFQVEHHLFPAISHVHYPQLSKIVAETAREYNVPYHSEKTFFGALYQHTKMLYRLGRE